MPRAAASASVVTSRVVAGMSVTSRSRSSIGIRFGQSGTCRTSMVTAGCLFELVMIRSGSLVWCRFRDRVQHGTSPVGRREFAGGAQVGQGVVHPLQVHAPCLEVGPPGLSEFPRSEERRVGTECVS